MSEPKDINDSEQEMHEVMDEENDKFDGGAGAGAQENPSTMEEKHSTLSAEPQEGIEIPTANDSIEDHDSDTKTNDNEEVAELGNGGLENGNEMSVDVEEKEVHAEDNQFDKTLARMDEKRPELGKGELENGNKLVDAEEKEIHPEKNQVDETALIEEGSGEDPAQSPDFDPFFEGDDDGTEEQQAAFMRALENFHKEMRLEFKPPKFYGEGLNCLKLWRAVTRLGGYDQVTSCKLWRQVGESFKPPKTCTTIAWSFRSYYEHALLEYEKHKISTGKFHVPLASLPKPMPVDNQVGGNHASGSGRARWDAAERAMQGWHSQRLLSNGKVGDPIIKDKTSVLKQDKYHKSIGTLKRKKASSLEHAVKASHKKVFKPQVDAMVVDDGQPADWVKINLKRTHTHTQIQPSVPTLSTPVAQDSSPSLVVSAPSSDPSGLKFKLPRQLSDLSAEQIHAWLSEMEVSGQADLYNQLLFLCALVEDFHSLSHEVSSATSATLEKIQEEVTRNRAQQEEFDKSISLAELKVAELKTAISQAENEVMELRRQRATLMLPDPQYIQELQREVAKQKVLDRISKVKAVALEVAYEQFFLNLD